MWYLRSACLEFSVSEYQRFSQRLKLFATLCIYKIKLLPNVLTKYHTEGERKAINFKDHELIKGMSPRTAGNENLTQSLTHPGGRGQLRLFAIGLLVRMMRAIVTSLPVKPGKFEWLINYKLAKFFSWMISQIILRKAIKESLLWFNLLP